MSEGIVYILINEGMPGLTKVGKTSTSVEQRMRELDSTGVPLPFECFHASKVADMEFVEKQIHDAFDDQRIRKRREFFRIAPERIQSVLLLVQIEDVTPRDDIVDDADDQHALDEARQLRAPFNFEMVGIAVGAELKFVKDDQITATVADNKKIEFEGEIVSLSSAALTAVHRMGYTWRTLAGPSYWMYEGETLDERRQRMQEGD